MSNIERAHLVLQPFRGVPVGPDRRQREKDGRAFSLDLADDESAPSPVEPMPVPKADATAASSGDEEGVGARVNVVA
ncbi:MAG: hypothetical protein JNL28_09125 [Planctomycetes bacterium]|nr:hypothetical protein [Planctomycetota bacterium]